MIGKTNIGGGGQQLNYSIVGSASQPTGRENLIWVNTENNITSHIFSATTPSQPSEGMVWFKVGTDSVVPFPATKKNPIMVYPQTCQQFTNGVWITKVATSYIGGQWVNWTLVLFELGNAHEEITGGYEGKKVNIGSSASTSTPTFNINTGKTGTLSSGTTQNSGAVVTKNMIDLTNFNRINFNIKRIKTGDGSGSVWIYVTKTASDFSNNYISVTEADFLDISNLSGEYYVAVGLKSVYVNGAGAANIQAEISSIILS